MPKHTKAEQEKNRKKNKKKSIFSNLFGGQITFDAEGIPTRHRIPDPIETRRRKKR